MDDICVGNFLFADDVARDEGYDELRGGDHGQHRPSSLVRNPTRVFLSGVLLSRLATYQDLVLRGVRDAQRMYA